MHQTFEKELKVQRDLYEYVHQGRGQVILQTQQVAAAPSQVLSCRISISQSRVQWKHKKLFIIYYQQTHTQTFVNKAIYKVDVLLLIH